MILLWLASSCGCRLASSGSFSGKSIGANPTPVAYAEVYTALPIDLGSGIIINPAAYSFTSIAILDALKMFSGPIVELHISNIHRREEHYHHSYVSKIATAVIAGLGPDGYVVATRAIVELIQSNPQNEDG